MSFDLNIPSLEAFQKFGATLATCLQPGDVVLLSGDLGAGKTTLVTAVLAAMGSEDHVTSPTFILIQRYQAPICEVVHADLYRLNSEQEIAQLDVSFLEDPKRIVFVEWADKLGRYRPESCVDIHLGLGKEEQARNVSIQISGYPEERFQLRNI